MDPLVFDYLMASYVPIVFYWIFFCVYTLLGKTKKYRLHSKEDEIVKNFITRREVYVGSLLQQVVQSTVSITLFLVADDRTATLARRNKPWWAIAAQFLLGLIILDGAQFFFHWLMHQNKFLYKNLHSRHHLLTTPYSAGTQFNHPVDGLIIETVPGILAYRFSGMSPRTAAFFYSFSYLKAMDDHSGLYIPWNPFHFLKNNVAYHEVHHMLGGGKYNMGQSFLTIWDKMFGTYMDYVVVEKQGGGFEVRMAKQC